jgi:hypothetical protein
MDAVANALTVARIRALRTALLSLHKALIDAERRRYEKVHGRIENPHVALRLVLEDPWFRWLHPIADIIVTIDERLADERAMEGGDLKAFADRVRAILQQDGAGPQFRDEYHRSLQEAPEVVVAHGDVARLLAADPPGGGNGSPAGDARSR